MTIGSKEALGIPTMTKRITFENTYQLDLRKILEKSRRKGQINLILRHRGEQYQLYIVDHSGYTNPWLANVALIPELTLRELSQTNSLETIMIFEKRETNNQSTFIQIAKELPAFFRSFYPETTGLPINIYDRGLSFRDKQPPIAVVRFENDLVTVTTPNN
jgi:hypothetical protein